MALKTTHLIFDFDGTLADTFHHLVEISNRLAEEFRFRAITPTQVKLFKSYSVLEVIRELEVPLLKVPQIVRRAQQELQKDIAAVDPFPGLHDALQALKARGVQMGILTTNSAKNVHAFLKNHDIDIFDFVVTTGHVWGKHTALKRLLKKHGLTAGQVVYIGDETRDIEAAQKAGVKIAAVTWGYNSAEALRQAGPDFLIPTPARLSDLL